MQKHVREKHVLETGLFLHPLHTKPQQAELS